MADDTTFGGKGRRSSGATTFASTLGEQLRAESNFRGKALEYLTSIVGPDAPKDLKVFVIVVVGSFLLMSFSVTIFGLHLLCSWKKICSACVPYVYLMTSLVPFVTMVGFGFPLVRRADQVEQVLRLKSSLTAISLARRHLDAPMAGRTP